MKINWDEFREDELKDWKIEIDDSLKIIEREMIKQQKRREKVNLRYAIAQKVESELKSGIKFLTPYQK